ncbi:MAG: membrane protein insertion efficiency factor YidD [candidate division WOR-3 bacterium]|nr:membrane protein insertion efficiency factor YidD [candidate division WOR-3 bacterium]
MAKFLASIIKFYSKNISPFFPRRCKYYPTCSSYAVEAFEKKGFFKGSILTVWRILRCNPFSLGGYDPVEEEDG